MKSLKTRFLIYLNFGEKIAMNLTTPLGLIGGIFIIYWAIHGEISNPSIFLNVHSIGIVIGGTVVTGLICFNFAQLKGIMLILFRQFLGHKSKERLETVSEIIKLSQLIKGGQSLESEVDSIKVPFLKEAIELYLEGGMSKDELGEVLEKRVLIQNERYVREGETFKTIGKFPPAFGLIGATLGMIGLLQGLGGPNGFENLGPAMSVALTATFWGLVLANLILLPLGENVSLAAEEDLIVREIVIEGVILLREKKHPIIVKEYLNSYLPPKDREKVVV